jgi:hypothetical protein
LISENLEEITPLLQWIVSFLKILGLDLENEPFEQLVGLVKHELFLPWLQGLFGNLK